MYCIKIPQNFLTKEHSIPKMELFIPLFVGALYCSSFTVSYQQGHKVQQCFAIDWSSTIPDDLVTIDLDSPIGYISIDHWLYMIDHQWQCITVDWSSTRPDALFWSLARAWLGSHSSEKEWGSVTWVRATFFVSWKYQFYFKVLFVTFAKPFLEIDNLDLYREIAIPNAHCCCNDVRF